MKSSHSDLSASHLSLTKECPSPKTANIFISDSMATSLFMSQNSSGCLINFPSLRLLLGKDFSLLPHLFTHPTHLLNVTPNGSGDSGPVWQFVRQRETQMKIIALYISPLIIVTFPIQSHPYTILKPLPAFSVSDEMQMNLFFFFF